MVVAPTCNHKMEMERAMPTCKRRWLTSKKVSSRKRISLQLRRINCNRLSLNFRPKKRRYKASSRSVTMMKEIRSSKTLNKSSKNLRKEMSNLSHKVLLPYSIQVIRSGIESITCLNSMSGFLWAMNLRKTLILDTQSRHQSTLTWIKEKTCQRSKAYKQRRLQRFFRPSLRLYSLGPSTFKSTPPLNVSICRSQSTLRASKIC